MHGSLLDPFDPDSWDLDWQFRLYAGEYADIECVVDEDDYHYFSQWRWKPHFRRNKIYFMRTVTDKFLGGRNDISEYLHAAILRRSAVEPESKRHCIVDHWDGNSLNNCRENLRWVTKAENNRNRFGASKYQLRVF